jgi:hypothetical protein
MDTLDDVLKDRGLTPRHILSGKNCLKKDRELLSVPLAFMVRNPSSACHA